MNKIWMVRAGEKAHLIEDFINNELISIGWSIESLENIESQQKIKNQLKITYPNKSNGWINMSASQIYKFRKEITKGEVVK